jgi:acyl-CoA thioester hydrolase
MAKPESWRLTPASYPVSIVMQTRFQDLDINRHLNNVAFAAFFENARVQINMEARLGQNRAPGERTMVANVNINYLGEGHYPGEITVCSGISHTGNSSWGIQQAMFQNGRCIATCDSVIVCRAEGRAMTLRPELRAELESLAMTPVEDADG